MSKQGKLLEQLTEKKTVLEKYLEYLTQKNAAQKSHLNKGRVLSFKEKRQN